MQQVNRAQMSIFGRWWWTVDRPLWFALLALMGIGIVMVTAASPMIAERLGYGSFHFVHKHIVILALSFVAMFAVSTLSQPQISRLAMLVFIIALALMVALPWIGHENKGAVRWLRLGGLSLQPSEFLKPAFAVVIAWVFSEKFQRTNFPGYKLAMALYAIVIALLMIQPDFGMSILVTAVFSLQFFLAGVPFSIIFILMVLAMLGAAGAYQFFPHVSNRIDRFLDPSSGDNYQVEKSLEAFQNGGFIGRGPGEGEVKAFIPDSHTDFIFAVAGEEYGALVCLMIIGLYAFIVLRGFQHLMHQQQLFTVLASAGLLAQFALQAIINMGVAVNLLPAKGMTLPFLSYGGSSMLALGFAMGMLLALTRKQFGEARRKLL